ncbi:MAG: hydrogenase maturation protease [Rhodospirillales bacterium]
MTLAIIGCGNPNRSDDGVGPEIINRLRDEELPSEIKLFDAGTDGMGVMYQARGASHLIILDARAPEKEPGAIYEVPGDFLEAAPPNSFNLHDFRWDHALYAGRQIYSEEFPEHVKVLLIEAESLDMGIGLTASVAAAADKVAERVRGLAQEFADGVWV